MADCSWLRVKTTIWSQQQKNKERKNPQPKNLNRKFRSSERWSEKIFHHKKRCECCVIAVIVDDEKLKKISCASLWHWFTYMFVVCKLMRIKNKENTVRLIVWRKKIPRIDIERRSLWIVYGNDPKTWKKMCIQNKYEKKIKKNFKRKRKNGTNIKKWSGKKLKGHNKVCTLVWARRNHSC